MPMPTDHVVRPRLALLDILRLTAALSVVAFHWLYLGPLDGEVGTISTTPVAWLAVYGKLGVHLFFIISGFVIFLSASGRNAAAFATGRATRLYPAFWAGVVLSSATLLITAKLTPAELLPKFLANLTMFPSALHQPRLDPVYWTLMLELEFYLLVFLFLLLRRRHWLEVFFPLWAVAMLGTTAFLPQVANLPLGGDYFTLFAGGAMIAMISRSGWSPLRAIGLAASVIGGVIASIRLMEGTREEPLTNPVVLGLLVVLLFVLVFILTLPTIAALRVPGSRFLGAMTYPLYLSHGVFGFALLDLWVTPETLWPAVGAAFAIVFVVALGIHYVVERAGARVWRALFEFVFRPVTWLEVRRPHSRKGLDPASKPPSSSSS